MTPVAADRARRARPVLAALAVVIGCAIAAAPDQLSDLPATYCGGRALLAGADPYLVQPATSCQLAVGHLVAKVPLPAPLPPFALAFFALPAALPFFAYGVAFVCAGIAAYACAVTLGARIARVPLWVAAIVFFWGPFYSIAPKGQVAVLAFAALVACAWALERDRWTLGAACAGALLVQPQFGLPVIAVVFTCANARARFAIAGVAAFVCILALLAGPALALEYFRFALPDQAIAEVRNVAQYSATWLFAYAFGAAPADALRWASILNGIVLAGATVAGMLWWRRGDRAMAVLGSAALSTFGSSYAHEQQIFLALPAGLYLAGRASPASLRIAAAFAAAVLGGEWFDAANLSGLALFADVCARAVGEGAAFAWLATSALGEPVARRRLLAGAAFVALAIPAACAFTRFPMPHSDARFPDPAAPDPSGRQLLAERWRTYNELKFAPGVDVRRLVALKALPWSGEAGIVFCSLASLGRALRKANA